MLHIDELPKRMRITNLSRTSSHRNDLAPQNQSVPLIEYTRKVTVGHTEKGPS
jgi:hypothetical protein